MCLHMSAYVLHVSAVRTAIDTSELATRATYALTYIYTYVSLYMCQ